MAPTVVILRQFTFSSTGEYTSFEQQLAEAELSVARRLPNLYCALLVRDIASDREVLGGCFFVTDWDHTNVRFGTLLRDIVLQVEPCAALYAKAGTIKPLKLNREHELPASEEMDAYALEQYAAVGVSGRA